MSLENQPKLTKSTPEQWAEYHRKRALELESKLAERDAEIARQRNLHYEGLGVWEAENQQLKQERDSLKKKLLDYEGQTNCCMECERYAKEIECWQIKATTDHGEKCLLIVERDRLRKALDSAKGFIIRRQCIGPDAEAIVSEISKALRQGEGEP